MKILRKYSYVMFLLLFSCGNHNLNVDNELKKCICKSTEVNLYELAIGIENILLEGLDQRKIINKNAYITRIDKIINFDVSKKHIIEKQLNKLFDKTKFDYENMSSYTDVFYVCPKKIVKGRKNNVLELQFQMLDKFFLSDAGSKQAGQVIKDWVLECPKNDFNKIEYRAPIILVLFNYLLTEQSGNGSD